MKDFISQHIDLLFCLLCCTLATILPRVLPFYCLRSQLPGWFKCWLDFVPAAVMAALVAPDIFFYRESFTLNPANNLFLAAGILSLLIAKLSNNFFATILFAMVFVASMRAIGWWS